MKATVLLVCLLTAVLLLPACQSGMDSAESGESSAAGAGAAADASDPLTGTWTGTWGPTPEHRNDVTLELAWDGTSLSGTVNPSTDAIPITNTSFDPATGEIRMEADAPAAHFMIDGHLDGGTMMGSWSHDGREGDFSISMR